MKGHKLYDLKTILIFEVTQKGQPFYTLYLERVYGVKNTLNSEWTEKKGGSESEIHRDKKVRRIITK